MTRPMALEPLLPAHALARATDPITSQEAAEGVNVTEKQRTVLRAVLQLEECGIEAPYTAEVVWPMADQLNHITHPNARPLGGSTVRSRLKELCDAGLMRVVDRTGTTSSGRRCARYEITPAGIDYLGEEHR